MAGKKSVKNSIKESVSLTFKIQQFIGYADYFNRVPLFLSLLLTNGGGEAIEDIDVTIESSDGLILPFAKHLDVLPFESSVEIAADNLVSPLYLTEISEIAVSDITLRVTHGKDVISEQKAEVTVLAFD